MYAAIKACKALVGKQSKMNIQNLIYILTSILPFLQKKLFFTTSSFMLPIFKFWNHNYKTSEKNVI